MARVPKRAKVLDPSTTHIQYMQKSLGHAHGRWRMGLSDLPFFCSPDDCVSRTTMTLVSRTYPGLNRQMPFRWG